MNLVRAFSRVDEQGRIPIPQNIRIQAKLKPGQLVEVKLQGPGQAKNLIIFQREIPR